MWISKKMLKKIILEYEDILKCSEDVALQLIKENSKLKYDLYQQAYTNIERIQPIDCKEDALESGVVAKMNSLILELKTLYKQFKYYHFEDFEEEDKKATKKFEEEYYGKKDIKPRCKTIEKTIDRINKMEEK